MDTSNLSLSIQETFGEIISTIRDILLEEDVQEDIINQTLDELMNKYKSSGFRLLSVPGTIKRQPRSVTKKEASGFYLWKYHPEDKNYSWSVNIVHNGRHYLKDNKLRVIVASIDENGVSSLDDEDKIFLRGKSLAYQETKI
jgi:hypothetical protein